MRSSVLWLSLMVGVVACKGGDDTGGADDTGAADHGEFVGIGLTPYNPTIGENEHVQLYAEGYYADGAHADVGGQVTWTSSDDRVATIDPSGVAIAVTAGTAEIVAALPSGVSARVTLTVRGDGAVLTGATVSPSSVQVSVGYDVQLAVNGNFSDGSTGNIAGSCAFQSANASVARVDASGAVTGVEAGSTTVSVSCDGLDAAMSVPVQVEEADFDWPTADLEVTGLSAEVTAGGDVVYSATVKNVGNGYARAFFVQAFLNSAAAPTDPNLDDAYAWVPGLAAGESAPLEITVVDPAPGSYSSWVVADLLDDVEETLDRNNAAGPVTVVVPDAPLAPPNLVVNTFYAITDGADCLWYVEVKNTGASASDAFWMDLYYNATDIPEAGPEALGDDFVKVPALAPGAGFEWEPDVTGYAPTNPGTGNWYSCVLADSNQDVDEANENDNVECVDMEWY